MINIAVRRQEIRGRSLFDLGQCFGESRRELWSLFLILSEVWYSDKTCHIWSRYWVYPSKTLKKPLSWFHELLKWTFLAVSWKFLWFPRLNLQFPHACDLFTRCTVTAQLSSALQQKRVQSSPTLSSFSHRSARLINGSRTVTRPGNERISTTLSAGDKV